MKHDRGFKRWPPHINMLYPFIEDKGTNFSNAAIALAQKLESIEPFYVDLNHVKCGLKLIHYTSVISFYFKVLYS